MFDNKMCEECFCWWNKQQNENEKEKKKNNTTNKIVQTAKNVQFRMDDKMSIWLNMGVRPPHNVLYGYKN